MVVNNGHVLPLFLRPPHGYLDCFQNSKIFLVLKLTGDDLQSDWGVFEDYRIVKVIILSVSGVLWHI